jgi:hypothetical protein
MQRSGATGRGADEQAQPDVVGIIISPGAEDLPAPRVTAYVWAPAPTGDRVTASIAA